MARLKQALDPEDVKALTVKQVKEKYNSLAEDYNKLLNLDYIYCPICGEFKNTATSFYKSRTSKSGYAHCGCKQCLLGLATDLVDKTTNERRDNREKTIEVFRMLDLPFIDEVYESQLNLINEEGGSRRGTAFSQLLTLVSSLPQYAKATFKDSVFRVDDLENNVEENTRIIQKTLRSGRKRFGVNYTDEQIMFLENEYQDWTTRYPAETKSQEILFKRVCCKELEIDQAQKDGKDTKEMDKTLQDLMSSLNIKPSQSNTNALVESQTFGQLIAKWEEEKPIPDPDPEFASVNKIGLYIDVFFKGHLAKMMGLKNGFSSLYDKYMSKYTVTKPQYDEDTDSEELFNQIFGSNIDEEE